MKNYQYFSADSRVLTSEGWISFEVYANMYASEYRVSNGNIVNTTEMRYSNLEWDTIYPLVGEHDTEGEFNLNCYDSVILDNIIDFVGRYDVTNYAFASLRKEYYNLICRDSNLMRVITDIEQDRLCTKIKEVQDITKYDYVEVFNNHGHLEAVTLKEKCLIKNRPVFKLRIPANKCMWVNGIMISNFD